MRTPSPPTAPNAANSAAPKKARKRVVVRRVRPAPREGSVPREVAYRAVKEVVAARLARERA